MSTLITLLQNTSSLEWACNLTALGCVVFAWRNHVLTWPFAIVSCILFTQLFMDSKLYAEAVLQVFFIATSAWGWWHWSAQKHKPAAPMVSTTWPTALVLVAAASLAGGLYALGLQRFTDASSPFWDSQILTLSMLAQWWLMRRNIACWGLWLVVNTISVPLYFSRELHVSGAFYAAYWVLAIVSYLHWKPLLDRQHAK